MSGRRHRSHDRLWCLWVELPRHDEDRPQRGPLTPTERQDLRYRLLNGLRQVVQRGAKVPADYDLPHSMPLRAHRSNDRHINRVPL